MFSASRNATVLITCMKSSFQVPSILVIDRIGRDPELGKVNLLTFIAFAAPFPCYYYISCFSCEMINLLQSQQTVSSTKFYQNKINTAAMASGKFSCPAQDYAPAGPQDDRKRRTPCREGWQGVESAQSGDYEVFRRKSVITDCPRRLQSNL